MTNLADSVSGKIGTSVSYTTKSLPTNYELVGDTVQSITINGTDAYVVSVRHKRQTDTETFVRNAVQQFLNSEGNVESTHSLSPQTVTIVRTTDLVTGTSTYDTPDSTKGENTIAERIAPDVPGYTISDSKNNGAITITWDNSKIGQTITEQTATFTYKPGQHEVVVNAKDAATGATLASRTITGVTNQVIDPVATAKSIVPSGYIAALQADYADDYQLNTEFTSHWANGYRLLAEGNATEFNYYVQQGMVNSTETRTITRTINVTLPGSTMTSTVQSVTFTRTVTVNAVTHESTSATDWTATNTTWPAYTVQTVTGYTPSITTDGTAATDVPAVGVTPETKNSVVNITYEANAESATIEYVDDDNNGSLVGSTIITGSYSTSASTGVTTYVSGLTGYKGLKDAWKQVGTSPSTYTFTDDANQTITVHLKHNTTSRTTSGTYVRQWRAYKADQNGIKESSNSIASESQKAIITVTGSVDRVTGSVTHSTTIVYNGQSVDEIPSLGKISTNKSLQEALGGTLKEYTYSDGSSNSMTTTDGDYNTSISYDSSFDQAVTPDNTVQYKTDDDWRDLILGTDGLNMNNIFYDVICRPHQYNNTVKIVDKSGNVLATITDDNFYNTNVAGNVNYANDPNPYNKHTAVIVKGNEEFQDKNGVTGFYNQNVNLTNAQSELTKLLNSGWKFDHADNGMTVTNGTIQAITQPSGDQTWTITLDSNLMIGSENKTYERTINYFTPREDGTIPTSTAHTATQYQYYTRTTTKNDVTGSMSYGPWTLRSGYTNGWIGKVDGDDPVLAANAVEGYTEYVDPKVANEWYADFSKPVQINPETTTQTDYTVNIYYKAKNYTDTVKFVDANGKSLNDDVTFNADYRTDISQTETTNADVKAAITAVKAKGYDISVDPFTTGLKQPAGNQTYTIVFKGTDSPITDLTKLRQTVTRTINTTNPDGTTNSMVQSVVFGRTGTHNPTTGDTYTPWHVYTDASATGTDTGETTGRWDAYPVPQQTGYTSQVKTEGTSGEASNATSIDANNNVTADTDNVVVDVTYAANAQTVQYQFEDAFKYDNDAHNVHIDYSTNPKKVGDAMTVAGKTGQTVNTGLTVPAGYILADGQTLPTTYTFKASGNDPIVIKLTHNVATSKDSSSSVRTLKFYNEDGTQASADVHQFAGQAVTNDPQLVKEQHPDNTNAIGFDYTGEDDLTTGKILWRDYTPASGTWDSYAIPQKAGYITVDLAPADVASALAGGNIKQNIVTSIPAKTDVQHDESESDTTTYITYLKYENSTSTSQITRTINVHNPVDGTTTTTNQSVQVQKNVKVIQLKGGVTIDIPDDDWTLSDSTKNSWASFTAPDFDGYKPSQDTVASQVVYPNETTNTTVDITYTADAAYNQYTANIKYVDDDNNEAQVGNETTIKGRAGQTIPITIKVPDSRYELATSETNLPTSYTFETSGNKDITIHLKHKKISTSTAINLSRAFVPAITKTGETGNLNDDDIKWNMQWDKQTDTATLYYDQDMVTSLITGTDVDLKSGITALNPDDVLSAAPTIAGYEINPGYGTVKGWAQSEQDNYAKNPTLDNNTFSAYTKAQVLEAINKEHLTSMTTDFTYTKFVPYVPYTTQADTHTATRMIELHLPSGNTTYVPQKVEFTRNINVLSGTTQKLNDGKETAWTVASGSATNWPENTPENVDGYAPNPATVAKQDVTANTDDTVVDVYYNQTTQKATVSFVDDDNNGATVGNSYSIKGTYGEVKSTNISSNIPTNYVLSSTQPDANYGNTWTVGKSDVSITVHLKHATQVINSQTKNVVRSIYRQFKDANDKAEKLVNTQTVTFVQNTTKDLVTGKTTTSDWKSDNPVWDAQTATDIPGYTLETDHSSAPKVTVTSDTADAKVVFIYDSNSGKLPVQFVDDDNNQAVVLQYDVPVKTGLTVKTGKPATDGAEPTTYYTDEIPAGYTLVPNQNLNSTFTWNGTDTLSPMVVHLTHGTATNSTTESFTRYIYIQLGSNPSTVLTSQTVTLTKTTTADAATGTVKSTTWSTGYFAPVDAPTEKGYTLASDSPKSAAFTTIGGSSTTPTNPADVTFKYNANETVKIIYVDTGLMNGAIILSGSNSTLSSTSLSGVADGKSVATSIQAPSDKYVISSVQQDGKDLTNYANYTFKDGTNGDITVYLKHAVKDFKMPVQFKRELIPQTQKLENNQLKDNYQEDDALSETVTGSANMETDLTNNKNYVVNLDSSTFKSLDELTVDQMPKYDGFSLPEGQTLAQIIDSQFPVRIPGDVENSAYTVALSGSQIEKIIEELGVTPGNEISSDVIKGSTDTGQYIGEEIAATIKYNNKTYPETFQFIDSTTNKEITDAVYTDDKGSTSTLPGEQSMSVQYLHPYGSSSGAYGITDLIQKYQSLGYTVVKNGYADNVNTRQDLSSHTYQIVLVKSSMQDSHTATRKITVNNVDGTSTVTSQVAKVTRSAVWNQATQQYDYGDWNTGTWESVTPAAVTGYTPVILVDGNSANSIQTVTVTNKTQDSNVVVSYTPTEYDDSVVIEDQDVKDADGNNKVLDTLTIPGTYNKTIDTTDVNTQLNNYEVGGYEVVRNELANPTTQPAEAHTYTIILKHKTLDVTDSAAPTRTITVNTPVTVDGSTSISASTVTQTVKFTRTGTKDLVTKDTNWNAWSVATDSPAQNWAEYDAPTIEGYTAKPASVGALVVKATTANATATIDYTGNDQSINITYVDDDENGAQVGNVQPLTGKTGETVPMNIATLDDYNISSVQQGDKTLTSYATYTFLPSGNQNVTVHLTHKVQTVAVSLTYTRDYETNLMNPDFKTVKEESGNKYSAQNYTGTAHVKVDQVTKTKTLVDYEINNQQSIPAVDTSKFPKIDGYSNSAWIQGQLISDAKQSDYNNIQLMAIPASMLKTALENQIASASDLTAGLEFSNDAQVRYYPTLYADTITFNDTSGNSLTGSLSLGKTYNWQDQEYHSHVESGGIAYTDTITSADKKSVTDEIAALEAQGYQLQQDDQYTKFTSLTTQPAEKVTINLTFAKVYNDTVNFVDADANNKSINDSVTLSNLKAGDTLDLTNVNTIIAALKAKHYVLQTNELDGVTTQPAANKTYTISFTEGRDYVAVPDKTFTYKLVRVQENADGTTTSETLVNSTATVSGKQFTNLITGETLGDPIYTTTNPTSIGGGNLATRLAGKTTGDQGQYHAPAGWDYVDKGSIKSYGLDADGNVTKWYVPVLTESQMTALADKGTFSYTDTVYCKPYYTNSYNFEDADTGASLHASMTTTTTYQATVNLTDVNQVISDLESQGYTVKSNPLTTGMTQVANGKTYTITFQKASGTTYVSVARAFAPYKTTDGTIPESLKTSDPSYLTSQSWGVQRATVKVQWSLNTATGSNSIVSVAWADSGNTLSSRDANTVLSEAPSIDGYVMMPGEAQTLQSNYDTAKATAPSDVNTYAQDVFGDVPLNEVEAFLKFYGWKTTGTAASPQVTDPMITAIP